MQSGKALKKKKCKICKQMFTPFNSIQGVCDFRCAVEFSKMDAAKKEKAEKLKSKREVREFKEANKTKTNLKIEAELVFRKYIRLRDQNLPCISCEGFKVKTSLRGGEFDAGHWHSKGAHEEVRFKLWNCHKQCKKCNRDLSGHWAGYEAGLMKRFSREWVERRKQEVVNANLPHYSKDYLRRIKRIFNRKIKIYQKYFR